MTVRDAADLQRVRAIADYQFGPGAGVALFPGGVSFLLSNTGRVRQVLDGGARVATVRARDGRLTLSLEAGRRLHARFRAPRWRVVVEAGVAPFVAEGGNVFAKHVVRCDPDIRALDEVLVVDPGDRLLAVGRARLGSAEMGLLKRGVAVETRGSAGGGPERGRTVPPP